MPADESVPTIYTDAVKLNVSPSTVTFIFSRTEGWLTPVTERELVRVQMSPTQFKILLRVLPDILSQYEASFGEIPVQGIVVAPTTEDVNVSEPNVSESEE